MSGHPSLVPPLPGPVAQRAAAVRLLALDVDGVLTDGTVWYGADGEALKGFHTLDGLGLRLLERGGVTTALISARESPPLRTRARDLAIPHVLIGRSDKVAAWEELLATTGIPAAEAAFMGDDLIDLGVLARAGLALAVPDAHPAVHAAAHWVTNRAGGHGAVREAAELLLAARGSLDGLIAAHAR